MVIKRTGICFNSQPPEGGWNMAKICESSLSGFNSQPPEGGWLYFRITGGLPECFNSQPPEGGWYLVKRCHLALNWFQLTAARRRLGNGLKG